MPAKCNESLVIRKVTLYKLATFKWQTIHGRGRSTGVGDEGWGGGGGGGGGWGCVGA